MLWIMGAVLNDGFTLKGTAILSWIDPAPTQSRLAFQVKIRKPGVVGMEDSGWGSIKKI